MISFQFFLLSSVNARQNCIDLGVGIESGNDGLSPIVFFKNGGAREPLADNGIITIYFADANNGDTYSPGYNNDFIAEATIVNANILTISDIPSGTIISSLSLTNNNSKCISEIPFNAVVTDSAVFSITDISLTSPENCYDQGSIIITLDNGNEGEQYSADLDYDNIYDFTDTLASNTLQFDQLPGGYIITNPRIRHDLSGFIAVIDYADTLQSPLLPEVTISDISPLCRYNTVITLNAGTPDGGDYLIGGQVRNSFNLSTLEAGHHDIVYRYTDSRGCSNSDTTTMLINDIPDVIIQGEQTVCPGSSEIIYMVDENQNYQYLWTVSGGEIRGNNNQTAVNINWTSQGQNRIYLQITDSVSGCLNNDSLSISFGDTIAPEFENCPSQYIIQAQADASGWTGVLQESDEIHLPAVEDNCSINNISLTFTINGSNPINVNDFNGYTVDPMQPATITWYANDVSNNTSECSTTLEFEFNDYIPSAFSPNNDETNNTWQIDFLEQYPECVVKVYNRWGMLVYESAKGYPVPWDGKDKDRVLPVDSYYYVITPGDGGRVFKGSVTIIY